MELNNKYYMKNFKTFIEAKCFSRKQEVNRYFHGYTFLYHSKPWVTEIVKYVEELKQKYINGEINLEEVKMSYNKKLEELDKVHVDKTRKTINS